MTGENMPGLGEDDGFRGYSWTRGIWRSACCCYLVILHRDYPFVLPIRLSCEHEVLSSLHPLARCVQNVQQETNHHNR